MDIRSKNSNYVLPDSEETDKMPAEHDAGAKRTENEGEGIKGAGNGSTGAKGTGNEVAGMNDAENMEAGNMGGVSLGKKRGGRASIKYSLLAAVLVTALFSLIFLNHYSIFQRNAQVFRGNGLQSDNFLVRMKL